MTQSYTRATQEYGDGDRCMGMRKLRFMVRMIRNGPRIDIYSESYNKLLEIELAVSRLISIVEHEHFYKFKGMQDGKPDTPINKIF